MKPVVFKPLGDRLLSKFVITPSALLIMLFVYGFMAFTIYLSFTDSKILPVLDWVGSKNYKALFAQPNWWTALKNLAIFGSLYIGLCIFIGLMLAIFLNNVFVVDQVFRPIYLYPMAISFIVTGTAWKWFLDPGIGLEQIIQSWGFPAFEFGWIKDSRLAIYCVVIAAVWQACGYVMTIFVAGLRSINQTLIEAARIDGASAFRLYWHIILPQLRPAFLSAFVILAHLAIKSYDLVIALTNGGPGRATELPATFMYSYTFTRNQMGVGAASAVIMLIVIAIIIIPYLKAESKNVD